VHNEAGAANVAEMGRQGIASFAPEQGCVLFSWFCAQLAQPAPMAAHVAVLPIDWARHARARGGRVPAWMRERIAEAQATDDGGPSTSERLAAATPAERRRLLETLVRDAVGRVLKLAPARIDTRKTLGSLGLSSLLAMELRNRLEAALQRPLSATLAWNHPTVEALVAYLAQNGDAPLAVAPTPGAPAAAPAATVASSVAAVAVLSDEEAAVALRARPRGGRR
jgi:myxalamid-type polyketide synthase MxaE and MxaD